MSRISCFDCPDGLTNRCDGCNRYEASVREECSEQTKADRIRGMSDEDLALMFTTIVSEVQDDIITDLTKKLGISVSLVHYPIADFGSQLDFLRRPWKCNE